MQYWRRWFIPYMHTNSFSRFHLIFTQCKTVGVIVPINLFNDQPNVTTERKRQLIAAKDVWKIQRCKIDYHIKFELSSGTFPLNKWRAVSSSIARLISVINNSQTLKQNLLLPDANWEIKLDQGNGGHKIARQNANVNHNIGSSITIGYHWQYQRM